jgi:hypothetical protein
MIGGSGCIVGTSLGKLGLEFHNILSLIPFRPFGNVEFYVITFVQRFETTGLNSGMVHENIIPGIAPDESVALFIVKPFNHALFFHFSSLFFTSKTCAARRDTIETLNCLFSFHSNPRGDGTKRRRNLHLQTLKTLLF